MKHENAFLFWSGSQLQMTLSEPFTRLAAEGFEVTEHKQSVKPTCYLTLTELHQFTAWHIFKCDRFVVQ